MSEPYTTDETELIDCYADVMEEEAGERHEKARSDAERGIEQIKEDALREYLEVMKDNPSAEYWRKADFVSDIEYWIDDRFEGETNDCPSNSGGDQQ